MPNHSHPDINAALPPPTGTGTGTESVELLPTDVTFEDASKAADELIDFTTPASLDDLDTNDLGEACNHPGCRHTEFGPPRKRKLGMIRHGVLAHPAAHQEGIRKIAEKLMKDTIKKTKNKKTKKSKAGKKGGSRHRKRSTHKRSKKRHVRKTQRKKRVRSSRRTKSNRRSRKSRR